MRLAAWNPWIGVFKFDPALSKTVTVVEPERQAPILHPTEPTQFGCDQAAE